jgi:hypothetical protein
MRMAQTLDIENKDLKRNYMRMAQILDIEDEDLKKELHENYTDTRHRR